MTLVLRVVTDDWDGDESGRHWKVGYILYEDYDDAGCSVYDLYEDDGCGNGKYICRFANKHIGVSITLRLGEFVEWQSKAA